jgi:hypothetical protein
MADDIAGIDDCIAVTALARRALLRQLVGEQLPACGQLFGHPRRPAEVDAFGPVIDTCACLRARGHEHGCLCAHGFERVFYRVDDDGRERYVTLPLR